MVECRTLVKGGFQVGDRIKETHKWYALATITEITERGFKYKFDEVQNIIPRLGIIWQEGECFEGGFYLWEILKESQLELKF